jgi:pimeloyl-ACP methyl ester carboxylesterase
MFIAAFLFLFNTSVKDTIVKKYYNQLHVPVTVKYSDKASYNLLVLPGYGFSDLEWCTKTTLCEKAYKLGFNLVFIEVKKSVYLKENLPQTSALLRKYPTRTWIIDSVYKPLLNAGVIPPNKKNFVMGLSTGARGAAILLLENPSIFSAGACLSGDFDPTIQKTDNLMINALGIFDKYASVWKGDNNIVERVKEFQRPIFIAHGKKDPIVPVEHSLLLKERLLKENPKILVKFDFPQNSKHDYKFWNSEVDNVLNFFINLYKK